MNKLNLIFSFLFLCLFAQVSFGNFCPVFFSTSFSEPICNGDSSADITVVILEGNPPFQYSFDGGDTFISDNFIDDIPAGTYEIIVREGDNGCSNSETILIPDPLPFQADLGQDMLVNLGDEAFIFPFFSAQWESFEWTSTQPLDLPDNPTIELNFLPLSTQTITLSASNEFGCQITESINIFVEKPQGFFIPNAFTPNGDGVNDFFTIFAGRSISQVTKFQITSPWNEIVFEQTNFPPNQSAFGWDGKLQGRKMKPGVFMYCIEVEYIDGETKLVCGDVTLFY